MLYSEKNYGMAKKFHEFYKALDDNERRKIIEQATCAFAKFLDSLEIDWKSDEDTVKTPMRVANMYVNDLLEGRFTEKPQIKQLKVDNFSNLEIKFFGPVKIRSICNHHCMPFTGSIVIGISGGENILGISQYSNMCNWYAKRGQLQERLGSNILDELTRLHKNAELSVFIQAHHTCFSHRGNGCNSSKLYTVHSTKNFHLNEVFISSCLRLIQNS